MKELNIGNIMDVESEKEAAENHPTKNHTCLFSEQNYHLNIYISKNNLINKG